MTIVPANTAAPDASALPRTRALGAVVRPGRGRSRRGFSLLEVLIVLAITATVAGIGVMRYSRSLSRYRVNAACAKLIADLRSAKAQACTTSSSRTVKFTPATATYQIMTAAQVAAAGAGAPTVSLADDPYRVTMTVSGLPGNTTVFNGRGEGNTGALISLRNGNVQVAVILDPNTGRAYVSGSTD